MIIVCVHVYGTSSLSFIAEKNLPLSYEGGTYSNHLILHKFHPKMD